MTKTLGVIGGGQLGRMLALASIPMGFRFCFLDPSPAAPAAELGRHILASYDDAQALKELDSLCDVVTYEFENVPVETLDILHSKLRPGIAPLQVSQDRLTEKEFFAGLKIATAPYRTVDSAADVAEAAAGLGGGILKSRRLGYDGKGQVRVHNASEAAAAWMSIGRVPAIYEGFVSFDREVSIIGARGVNGDIVCYPLIQNVHRDGILRMSTAPAADIPANVQQNAEQLIASVLEKFQYIGVLTIELFLLSDGQLVVNEMAPRVHNSGHLTIEAAITSQFENHIRAIAGLPLGSTKLRHPAIMLNGIGQMPAPNAVLADPDVHYHHYGKEDRPGRKVGHITICGNNHQAVAATAASMGSALQEAGTVHG